MSTAISEKEMALQALGRMPESSTLMEISEEIGILAKIRRGIQAADADKVLTHAEVERRSQEWITK